MAKASKRGGSGGSKSVSGSGAPAGGAELQRLERILQLMESHDVAELEWEKSGERISLRTRAAFGAPANGHADVAPRSVMNGAAHPAPVVMHVPAPAPVAAPAPAAAVEAPKAAAPAANQKQVVSPFVGTFYRSPSPTAEVYVKEGSAVKRGDVLCIIEAMKLMNEIEAEFPGKIVSVLVENGQPVEFGEPLFLIET